MATEKDIIVERERIEALRQEISDHKQQQAVAAVSATTEYQLDRLKQEGESLANQLQSLRDADVAAEKVKAFNESSQEDRDAAAFASAKEFDAAAAAEVDAVRAAEIAAMAEDATKNELLKQASTMDIQGRSSMNKEELAEAIADAGTTTQGVK